MNANHVRRFRPVMAGIEIFNPHAGASGTLGLLAEDAGGQQWLVSCHHVLCRADGSVPFDDEPVFQGGIAVGTEVARTVTAKSDPVLDVAAARLLVDGAAHALGVGPVSGPGTPVVGMRVIKSGASTGVTEGIIQSVDAERVTIAIPTHFPRDFDLSERGDSGAPWIDATTRAIVAMHTSGTAFGVDKAFAVPVDVVLAQLGLQLLVAAL